MSEKYKIDGIDWQKVKVGAGVAFGGALITYLPTLIDGVTYTIHGVNVTPFVQVVASVLVNVVRKWLSENSKV